MQPHIYNSCLFIHPCYTENFCNEDIQQCIQLDKLPAASQLYIMCVQPCISLASYLFSGSLYYVLVTQVEQIVYSTESFLEEENDAIVKQVVVTHNKSLQSDNDKKLRKFRSMPHVMRSFFQSGSSSSSNDNCCDGNISQTSHIPYNPLMFSPTAKISSRYHIAVLEKEV